MTKKEKRNLLFIALFFIGIFTVIGIFNELMFYKTSRTCGVFYKVGTSSYIDYYHYKYSVNGDEYFGSINKKSLKIKSLDSLKQITCVEIEYSKYLNSYSIVSDIRVIN